MIRLLITTDFLTRLYTGSSIALSLEVVQMLFTRPIRLLIGRPSLASHFHYTPSAYASRKVLQTFKLADIGEGITECEVIKWSVYIHIAWGRVLSI